MTMSVRLFYEFNYPIGIFSLPSEKICILGNAILYFWKTDFFSDKKHGGILLSSSSSLISGTIIKCLMGFGNFGLNLALEQYVLKYELMKN